MSYTLTTFVKVMQKLRPIATSERSSRNNLGRTENCRLEKFIVEEMWRGGARCGGRLEVNSPT